VVNATPRPLYPRERPDTHCGPPGPIWTDAENTAPTEKTPLKHFCLWGHGFLFYRAVVSEKMEYQRGGTSKRNSSKSIEKYIGLREIWQRISLHACVRACVRACVVLLGVAYNFQFRAGWPVSRCDISVYTCYYQCKWGGLKNANSGACTLKKNKIKKKCRTEEANPVYRTSPNSTKKCCRAKWRKWHGFALSDSSQNVLQ